MLFSYVKSWNGPRVGEAHTAPLNPEARLRFLKDELADAEKAVADEKAKAAAEKAAAERAAAERAEAAKTPGRKFAEEQVKQVGEDLAMFSWYVDVQGFRGRPRAALPLLQNQVAKAADAFLAAHRPAFDEKLAREIAERMVPQNGQVITFNGGKVYLLHPGLEWDVRNYITYAIQEYARRVGKAGGV